MVQLEHVAPRQNDQSTQLMRVALRRRKHDAARRPITGRWGRSNSHRWAITPKPTSDFSGGTNITAFDYDFFVIGGGSGGARASAQLGKRDAIAEEHRMGGTCVIRGCVPKKLYVYAAQFPEHFQDATGYGWSVGQTSFNWRRLVAAKETEIAPLEDIYRSWLEKAGAAIFASRAVLLDDYTAQLETDGHPDRHRRTLRPSQGAARS
jgi:hypothetical protein